MIKIVKVNGRPYDFDAVVNLMDDDLREQLHSDIAPCAEQEFVDAYIVAHQTKFSETFLVN